MTEVWQNEITENKLIHTQDQDQVIAQDKTAEQARTKTHVKFK